MATNPNAPQPGEIVEEFFFEDIPDPKVPVDKQTPETTVKKAMVRLYGGEFSKPTRFATRADTEAHPAEWEAAQAKLKEAGEELPNIDNTLPPEEGEGLDKPPPGTDPPLGGGRGTLEPGHPSGQPVRPGVEPHTEGLSYEKGGAGTVHPDSEQGRREHEHGDKGKHR